MTLKDSLIAEIDRLKLEINRVDFGSIIFHIEHNNYKSYEIRITGKPPKNQVLPLTETTTGDRILLKEGKIVKF